MPDFSSPTYSYRSEAESTRLTILDLLARVERLESAVAAIVSDPEG